jgi:2-polyprenyl-3-methyl-5-hydroxy-6-metoxy-1,4-benzoquinol methylase
MRGGHREAVRYLWRMSSRAPQYRFEPVDRCNMCGSSAARVLGKRLGGHQGRNPRAKVGLATTIVRCVGCGLVYPNPMPVPASIQAHYGTPPEDYWKESYFRLSDDDFGPQLARLQSLGGIRPGAKALDVGAGIGKAMKALERAGFDVFGLEPSPAFRERAIARLGIRADRILEASIEGAEYEAGTFDFANLAATLEHIYDPAGALEKTLGWMKPGGLVHVEVPSSQWLVARLANLYYRARGTDYVTNLSPMHVPFHLYEFTLRSFERHAAAHAYEIAFAEHTVCETFLPKAADIVLVPLMQATKTGMQLTVWLRQV